MAGDTVREAEVPDPVPLSATLRGVEPLLTGKPQLAVRVPVAAGLKMMVVVQVAAAAKVDPQVVEEIAKSPASVPVTPWLPSVTDPEAGFDMVIV